MAAVRPVMVSGYLVVDRSSGLVRAWRRQVTQAFQVADAHHGSVVMLVKIPASQEAVYLAAEAARAEGRPSSPPPPDGEFVKTVTPEGTVR